MAEYDDECINSDILKAYEHLEQLCGTPNIYRRFESTESNDSDSKSPHQLATRIYKYFSQPREEEKEICLTLEFDQATIDDILLQKKKGSRLYSKIHDAFLRDHSTFARHNIRRLFYHFRRILEPDKSSINGLSLNYITVLFAPIIICVKISDESNPVLKAAIQTAIFQTIFYRMNDFFSNIDRTNQINPTRFGTVKKSSLKYNIEVNEDVHFEQLRYKSKGRYVNDDWLIVKTSKGIGICPESFINTGNNEEQQPEETSKDDLAEKDVQYYHDFY